MRAREHIGDLFLERLGFLVMIIFFGGFFLKERKRLGFESKEKRCIRKVYIYNILLIFLGET